MFILWNEEGFERFCSGLYVTLTYLTPKNYSENTCIRKVDNYSTLKLQNFINNPNLSTQTNKRPSLPRKTKTATIKPNTKQQHAHIYISLLRGCDIVSLFLSLLREESNQGDNTEDSEGDKTDVDYTIRVKGHVTGAVGARGCEEEAGGLLSLSVLSCMGDGGSHGGEDQEGGHSWGERESIIKACCISVVIVDLLYIFYH